MSAAHTPRRFDVFYLGDCVARGVEAESPARAIADYVKFNEHFGQTVKLDWLDAREADEGFKATGEAA